ncbi:MAG: hypothetical protein H0X02_00745 [Nitrosomonas sp.]|nr:hypothetical protein [Nitrosomonas sp.]
MGPSTLDNMDTPSFADDSVPFQFREKKTEQETHRWLKSWFEREYENAYTRFVMYRRYINMYKNLDEYEGDGLAKTSTRISGAKSKKPKVRDNLVYSYTEQRVAQVSKQKTALTFIPRVQNSQDDLNAAKATKILVRARYEDRDFDGDMIRMDRTTYLLGHSLYEESWDKNEGPIAPSYIKAKEKFKAGIPVIDEPTGKPIDGKTLDKAIKVGDTKGRLWQPYQWFAEPGKFKTKDCDYLNTFEWLPIQLVEARHPSAKGKIRSSEYVKWDFATDRLDRPNNQILVHTFWHKPTEFYPEGCKIVWCEDTILEEVDFPYNHGNLPFTEEKDIEVEGEYWGRPFVTNIEQFYKVNNSLISCMARNHGVLNAPKIMFPEGAVDLKSWNNEFSAVQYRGNIKPEILQHNYVNTGELEFQKHCQSRAGELAGVFDISRGIVPPGITAASAIRYLDEQEHQRANPSISKRKRRILDITRQEVSLMAQNYKDTDERTARLVGENNEFIIKSFKKLAIGTIADVRYENTSSIADTKTGAIADIIDLNASNQKDPVFGRKEIIKMLDMGLDEAFKDETSYAIDTARTILEALLDGEEKITPPEKTDGLLEFYSVFGRFVESLIYKQKLDPQIKQAINAYIEGLELLMWQKSVENLKFGQLLLNYEKYPMFFSPPAPPVPMTPPSGEAPGAGGGMETDKMDFQKQNIEKQMNEQGDA